MDSRIIAVVCSALIGGCNGQSNSANKPIAAPTPSAPVSSSSASTPSSLGRIPKPGRPITRGTISSTQIDESLPHGLLVSERQDVEHVMKKQDPERRQFVRWAKVHGGFVVWVQDPAVKATFPTRPEGLGYRVLNWTGTWYYFPLTGELQMSPGA